MTETDEPSGTGFRPATAAGERDRAAPTGGRRVLRIALRVAAGSAVLAALVVAAGAGWLTWKIRASLPVVAGERRLAELDAPVIVERDALGVPTVRGASRLDVARATGWLHAQDRLFQMDLLRRSGAGELAALVGAVALPLDRRARVHRFRARAADTLAGASPETAALLQAYAAGVEAGRRALGASPPEYLALGATPEPWRAEDTLLVLWAMYRTLQDERATAESTRGVMSDVLPPELVAFLTPLGTEWDAALDGSLIERAPIPPADVFDLRERPATAASVAAAGELLEEGSNAWAAGAGRTAAGHALVANDMHLDLALPATFYRIVLEWPDERAPAGQRRLVGVTLPGAPVLVAGSTGEVAWGLTNSYADLTDLVVVEPLDDDPGAYRTPAGARRFESIEETLAVRGGRSETLEVITTIWGPLVGRDHRGRPLALRWIAHVPGAANAGLERFVAARSVEELIALAPEVGIPTQNLVAADRAGRVAWTLVGPLPRRVGFDGRLPVSWADGRAGWDGFLDAGAYPRVVDPPQALVWSANQRTLGGGATIVVGDGTADLGARARQLRDGLLALEAATAGRMLELQLDDRALFLERWRELLLGLLDEDALEAEPARRELRRVVENGWSGRASVESAAYRLVRGFRLEVAERSFAAITAACRGAQESFNYFEATRQWEGPLWQLVTERPPHLLAPGHASWREALLAAADRVAERLGRRGPLAERTWGERNTVVVGHPLSAAVPRLASWLDLPPQALPGDRDMPRVQGPRFGAALRMVVSPGREEAGLFHMPGGQSGHPLSPWYRASHEAWAMGRAQPLLPGPPQHVLRLVP